MMRSGGVSQDGSDREQKLAHEQRVQGKREMRAWLTSHYTSFGGQEKEREKSFEVKRGKKATKYPVGMCIG